MATPSLKYIGIYGNSTKESLPDAVFMEVEVVVYPEQACFKKKQEKLKQSGLKNRVTGTIFVSMVNILISMATGISQKRPNF